MSKVLLLKQTELSEAVIAEKIQARELVVNLDTGRLYLGLRGGEIAHLADSVYVGDMIKKRTLPIVLSTTPAENIVDGSLVFNGDSYSVQFINGSSRITLASIAQLPYSEPQTVVVSAENIDIADGSVSLNNFSRPSIMVYVDGILCVPNDTASKRYIYNSLTKELKVFGCVADSIIAFF